MIRKERTVTSVDPVLSHNTVYSFLPERYPHKPYVKEDYPRNVTALVNTTVMFNCPTYSDLEPHIQWVKMPHMFEEGTDPMEDNSTLLVQVRGDVFQEQGATTACTLACWISITNPLLKCGSHLNTYCICSRSCSSGLQYCALWQIGNSVSSETLICMYQTTWCHSPEDSKLGAAVWTSNLLFCLLVNFVKTWDNTPNITNERCDYPQEK